MERQDIIEAAKKVHDRYSLLVLLNRLKEDDLGDKAHPFTMAQLNYFCHPSRNAQHYVIFHSANIRLSIPDGKSLQELQASS